MDDDEFSDDGFDDLNDTVLEELEKQAIQSTQAQRPLDSQLQSQPSVNPYTSAIANDVANANANASASAKPSIYDYGFDDDDLDDTVVIDELAQPPPGPHGAHATTTALPLPPHQQPRGVVANLAGQLPRPVYPQHQNQQYPPPTPRPAPPLPSQRFPARPAAHSRPAPPPPPQQSQFARSSQFVRPALPISRPLYGLQPSQAIRVAAAEKQNDIVAALQARLSALETEATAAKGEAAILRSKYDKAQMTHESEIARLKKETAEQAAKQKRIVEEAQAAERTAATELQFERQILKEELGRVKTRKKDGQTTPKKNRTFGRADGFDGIEIMSSPSKCQAQKRKEHTLPAVERTPTKGKRKRPAVDSPTFALEMHSEDAAPEAAPRAAEVTLAGHRLNALPYDFLKLVLSHSPLHDQPLTFDLLSRFALPSDPSQTFASIIFQKLPKMGTPEAPLRLLVDFAELLIEIWGRCLSEKYHGPIYHLAALISYTLQLNTLAVAPHIVSSLVPVCATTCRLVAVPRFSSADGDISNHPDHLVRQLYVNIDVTQSLSLLYLTALACSSPSFQGSDLPLPVEYSPQTQFWKSLELEFVLMMLSPKQPEPDWFGTLSLLWTSVLPESIGPIPNPLSSRTYIVNGRSESETPELVASMMVDRVSSFLFESPRWAPPRSVRQILVRLEALKTLLIFATSPFGAIHIAKSKVAIPRLVTVLSWAISRLYDMEPLLRAPKAPEQLLDPNESRTVRGNSTEPLELGDPPRPGQPARKVPKSLHGDRREKNGYVLLCRFIGHAVFLLHRLVTDPRTADVADVVGKLEAAKGGAPQRYLITLARLSSSEDLVLEAGIDAETVELAHELLESVVTPETGKEIGILFGE
ncbi:hypothetical protein B0H63DRAFT_499596 [Podospora didyma]|uniref:DNA repair protein Rad26 n=1 Tax=Podospora didyma TaxID=330526 RepID=A0AAE0NXK9_9PEZI|nr:hypothetical protein B0H63DRAFT_499596 [Podospora didyma]